MLWFGHVYDKDGMSVDPAKVQIIKDWSRPKDKAGVKSFLQTVQFCQVFMRPGQDLLRRHAAPQEAHSQVGQV